MGSKARRRVVKDLKEVLDEELSALEGARRAHEKAVALLSAESRVLREREAELARISSRADVVAVLIKQWIGREAAGENVDEPLDYYFLERKDIGQYIERKVKEIDEILEEAAWAFHEEEGTENIVDSRSIRVRDFEDDAHEDDKNR